MRPLLEPVDFGGLAGWSEDDHLAALRAFERSVKALTAGQTSPRPARQAPPELVAAARASLCSVITTEPEARRFFETRFRPFRVVRQIGAGFLTGYYEPCIPVSKVESEEFGWPMLARPADLVTFGPETAPAGFPAGVSGAGASATDRLSPTTIGPRSRPSAATRSSGFATPSRPSSFRFRARTGRVFRSLAARASPMTDATACRTCRLDGY